ncbi:MAG TPA: DUF1524 domain-containing protein [Bacteriovoracaceae bacterium]|nr:DUF1524 domain-containing protein [Bacteriovoracaceae bacterium]
MLTLSACAQPDVTYKRKDWQSRWADDDKNCRDTRAEILIERSLVPVTFTNKKKCRVRFGEWKDYYYPEIIKDAKMIDIDHLVPLYEAHKSGGSSWSKLKRKEFANDPDNLVITSRTTNRQKGANTLKNWLPMNIKYACRYYYQWMSIKKKYELKISDEEINSLDLSKCIGNEINSL